MAKQNIMIHIIFVDYDWNNWEVMQDGDIDYIFEDLKEAQKVFNEFEEASPSMFRLQSFSVIPK